MMTGRRPAYQLGDGVCDAAPATATARARHPNSGLIDALWVSDDCVGLTALYAALNGIRFALAHQHRFTASEVHKVMSSGLRFFEGRLTPRQCVVSGIRVQLWRDLVAAMSEATWQLTGRAILVERVLIDGPGNRGAVFDALDDAVARLRVPLMLLRGGVYTVVSGTTTASILLFDSRGCSWISKRSCGVPRDGAEARHMICPTALLALNV